jgi:hypothetical protein
LRNGKGDKDPRLFEAHHRGPRDAQNAAPRHPAQICRHGLLPSVAEKVRPSTSVSCMYLAPAIAPEAGTGNARSLGGFRSEPPSTRYPRSRRRPEVQARFV